MVRGLSRLYRYSPLEPSLELGGPPLSPTAERGFLFRICVQFDRRLAPAAGFVPTLGAAQWLVPELVAERLQLREHLRETVTGPRSTYAQIACLEAGLYMRNQLLRDTDWANMAHSLEVRVPFVDTSLLRTLAPAILGARRAGLLGKLCLAQGPMPPLPASIQQRSKTGFSTPIAHWLAGRTPKHWHWSRHWAIWVAKHWKDGVLNDACLH